MGIEVDHAFIACRPGAPEAAALLRHGLVEGTPNTHPGQGTANRRFFFNNFMLELLWISDEPEATSERTRRTRLWERCAGPRPRVCPFGILFRPDAEPSPPPFRTWAYHPAYLPAHLAIEFAEGTSLHEPELIHLPFARTPRTTPEATQGNPAFQRLSAVAVGVCDVTQLSAAALAIQQLGKVRYFAADQPLLALQFEGERHAQVDLRPELPLVMAAGNPATREGLPAQ